MNEVMHLDHISSSLPLGVTGGIAVGKTTVSLALIARLQARGVECRFLSIDKLRAELLEQSLEPVARSARKLLVEGLGREIETIDGFINRRRLADIIDFDLTARTLYEKILDPIVSTEIYKFIISSSGIAIVEWALIVEKGLLPLFQHNIVQVECSRKVQLQRLSGGDLPKANIGARFTRQFSSSRASALIIREIERYHQGVLYRTSTELGLDLDQIEKLADALVARLAASHLVELCRT